MRLSKSMTSNLHIFTEVLVTCISLIFLVTAAPSPPAKEVNHGQGNGIPGRDGSKSSLEYLGTVDGKAFYLDATLKMTWAYAKAYCREADMGLAAIETKEEWELLNRTLAAKGPAFTSWTSATEAQTPSMLVWDGTRNTPDMTVLPHWWWWTDRTHCAAATTLIINPSDIPTLEMDVIYCTFELHVLCQSLA